MRHNTNLRQTLEKVNHKLSVFGLPSETVHGLVHSDEPVQKDGHFCWKNAENRQKGLPE